MADPNDKKDDKLAPYCMFFAGLILLIPHRIGMSRVNYVIKRYNLPISRAGLLLYKFHNPIEVSLTIGTLFGNIINWTAAHYDDFPPKSGQSQDKPNNKISIRWSMVVFLILMLFSSIFMFIVYIIGSDYGYLYHFYFSLILITFFDGAISAFAFCINAKEAAMLSAGIPTSGALVSLLHNIYKFFSDGHNWDNFDYHVLRIQLLINIITIFVTIILWTVDACLNPKPTGSSDYNSGNELHKASIGALFNFTKKGDDHTKDLVPIALLAISLGTVYAFYPSIAPYSIIDYQYASIIELWILIISAIPTLVIAGLDFNFKGPAGALGSDISITSGVTVSANSFVNFSGQSISYSNIKVKHEPAESGKTVSHGDINNCNQSTDNNGHNWNTGDGNYIPQPGDKYKDSSGKIHPLSKLIIYYNWFHGRKHDGAGDPRWTEDDDWVGKWWNLVWLCAIFYILCIQIFMTLLHYPDSLLSCFFNNHPYVICFISVLFNTLRETMQAFGFAGAGKQAYLDTSGKIYTATSITDTKIKNSSDGQTSADLSDDQILLAPGSGISGKSVNLQYIDPADNRNTTVNGTIAATNKLITLFVMMFCVFTVIVNEVVKDLEPPLKP